MGSRTADAVVRAYLDVTGLKGLPRAGWLLRGVGPDDCESVADHTLGVAMLCLLLLDGRGLDRERVLHMALIHDLGEARVGDITPSDGISDDDKHQLEAAAVRDIAEGLSGGERHRAIWEEYEAGATPEARFVKQVDKLEMALQAAVYDRQGYDGLDEFLETARRAIDDPELLQLLDAAAPVLSR